MATDRGQSRRYAAVAPKDQPRRAHRYRLIRSAITAPVLGSRVVFPGRFDAAVARSIADHRAADIAPAHALRYFGTALRLWVHPLQLRLRLSDFVNDERGPRWIGSSFLDPADWKEALAELAKSPVHREMVQLVAADLDFRRTSAYRNFRKRARTRPFTRNGIELDNAEKVDGYFRYCVDLVASMREHGVVPRRDLEVRGIRPPVHAKARPTSLERAERDIGVAIGENGDLIRHLGGKHRTAVAQAIGLERIPVEVRLVHVRWLKRQLDLTGLPAHQALPAGLANSASAWRDPPGRGGGN